MEGQWTGIYNLVLMLRMIIPHTHTSGDYEKICFSHNNAIWGEQGRAAGSSKNDLRNQGEQRTLEFIIAGGWGWSQGSQTGPRMFWTSYQC